MKKKLYTLFVLFLFALPLLSQQTYTLEEALKFASENNAQIKKTKIDRQMARQKVKETIGIGLPQINGQAKYNYYLNIPVTLIDASALDPSGKTPKGTIQEFPMGLTHNANAGLTLTQMLFNGSYLVGLQSATAYQQTMSLAEEKTQISIKEAIKMAYTSVLITDENIKTLEENKKIAQKSLNDTKITYKTGLIELQNVEQLEYSFKSLETNLDNLKRTREKLMGTLKYLMGIPAKDHIILTSPIDELIKESSLMEEINTNEDLKKHIDYRLGENALKLNELKLKLQKVASLPSLSFFANSSYSTGNNNFTIFNTSNRWFNASILGLQLDVPIFSGLQRHWKTQQAKLDYEKAQIDLSDTEQKLKNNLLTAKVDYENTSATLKSASEMVTLSESIFRKQYIKFKEGLGSSFDLQQAENQLYTSQAQYYQAAINVVQAKTKLDEALGKF